MTARAYIYQETRAAHTRVERLFGLGEEVCVRNYSVFLEGLYHARMYFSHELLEFEGLSGYSSFNADCIGLLREDLESLEAFQDSSIVQTAKQAVKKSKALPSCRWSYLAGIFYVFAGSSAGSRMLIKLINISNPGLPTGYLSTMVNRTADLMGSVQAMLVRDTLVADEAVNGAQATFECIYNCGIHASERRKTEIGTT